MKLEDVKRLGGVHDAFQTGSTVICNPPVTDTDIDFAIFCEHLHYDWMCDWEDCGDYNDQDRTFCALRKGKVNLLVFTHAPEFNVVKWATNFATRLNITDKMDRYDLFETVRELAKP